MADTAGEAPPAEPVKDQMIADDDDDDDADDDEAAPPEPEIDSVRVRVVDKVTVDHDADRLEY